MLWIVGTLALGLVVVGLAGLLSEPLPLVTRSGDRGLPRYTMTRSLHRLATLLEPAPLTSREVEAVVAFLQVLVAAGGSILDSDPVLNSAAASDAERHDYTNGGGGWSVGVSITKKGLALLADAAA